MTSRNSSDTPAKVSVTLTLNYLPPSLNVLHGRHWSVRWRERNTAMIALACAIDSAVADPLTPTTLMPLLKRSQTYFGDQELFRATMHKKYASKLSSKKSLTAMSKEPKSPSHGQ